MSDYMLWLYANFIQPQMDEILEGDYTVHFQSVWDSLSPDLLPSWDKCEEFLSIHAFLLGLATGAGLAQATQTTSPPAWTQP